MKKASPVHRHTILLLCAAFVFTGFFLLKIKPALLFRHAKDYDYQGLWSPLKDNSGAKKNVTKEKFADLSSLSYLQGYQTAPRETGVTVYDKKAAYKGVNLFTSGHAPEAFLMNMDGNILHKWHYDVTRIWPITPHKGYGTFWVTARPFDNGDLLAIYEYIGVIKLDKDSNLLWAYKANCHHDLDIDEAGRIYLLTAREIRLNDDDAVLDNLITVLDGQGKPLKSISLFELFKKIPDKRFIRSVLAQANKKQKKSRLGPFGMEIPYNDVFHANTIEVLDGRFADRSPVFKKGNILVSILKLEIAVVVDMEKEEIVWLAGPSVWKNGQHNCVLTGKGTMLVFENHYKPGQSRVIEFDPLTQKILWQYTGEPKNQFYSKVFGANERLANGNTLITESCNGRAFEVTPEGKIVWEFFNPHRTGDNNELIAVLLKMNRLPADFPLGWLKKTTAQKAVGRQN